MANISRSRGDTYPVALDLKDEDSGQPYLIPGGSTFLLTVNEISLPTDASEQVFRSAGEVVNASLGMVRFPISAEAADILGTFYHDVQMTAPTGLVRTVDKGQYIVKQDITKSLPSQMWVPTGIVGEDMVRDGSEFWYGQSYMNLTGLQVKYADRDGSRVIAHTGTAANEHAHYYPAGAESLRPFGVFGPPGVFQFKVRCYLSEDADVHMALGGSGDSTNASFQLSYDDLMAYVGVAGPNDEQEDDRSAYVPLVASLPCWLLMTMEVDYDNQTVKGKVWEAAGAEPDWMVTANVDAPLAFFLPYAFDLHVSRRDSGATLEIASFAWEQTS